MSSTLVQSGTKLERLGQLAGSLGITATIEIAEGYPLALKVGLLTVVFLRDAMIEVRSGQRFVGPLHCEAESYAETVREFGMTINGNRIGRK